MRSTYFHNMRDPVTHPIQLPVEPILVDLPDWLIRDFLGRIYSPFQPDNGRFRFKTTSHRIYIRLYAFYQNFKIEEGIKNIQEDMNTHAAEEPWMYLRLGSRFNSIKLASLAFRHMTPVKLADPLFWEHVDSLRSDWRAALLSSLLKRINPVFDSHGSKTIFCTEDDVIKIENNFLTALASMEDVEIKEEEYQEGRDKGPVADGKKRKERK